MNSAETIRQHEQSQSLMRLSEFQDWFIGRYSQYIPAEVCDHFRRELLYMIHLTYREAQQPAMQQMMDFAAIQTRPIVYKAPK